MAHIPNGPQTLIGTEGDDLLTGHRHNDTISGLGGNDRIIGGFGNDEIHGGDGDDRIEGHRGADDLYGGAGSDTFQYKTWDHSTGGGGSRDTIHDFEAQDFIDFSEMEGAPTSLDQISVIEGNGQTDWQVVVDYRGDGSLLTLIDIIGVQPTDANFII